MRASSVRDSPDHVISQPVRLSPPLRESWSFTQGFAPRMPVVGGGLAFIKRPRRQAVAVDERSGVPVWTYPEKPTLEVTPEFLCEEGLLVAIGDGGNRYQLIDPDSRKVLRKVEDTPMGTCVVIDDVFVQGGFKYLNAWNWRRGTSLWKKNFGKDSEKWLSGVFAATDDVIVFGLGGGPVVCVETRTGKEVWRATVGDLTWTRHKDLEPGQVRGPIVLYRDHVIVEVWPNHVVALSLRDGRREWTYEGYVEEGHLYRDRYYVFGSSYAILDPRDGRVLFRKGLKLPRSLEGEGLSGPALVSETHLFAVSNAGSILAWERDTAAPVWHAKPQGALRPMQDRTPLISRHGRLYYGDMSYRIICLEEENPTDPVLKAQRAGARRR